MKTNVKNLIIVFLVALLGSGLGTFSVLSYYNSKNTTTSNNTNNVVINEVDYTNYEKSDLSEAIEKAYKTVVEIKCSVKTTTSSSYFFFGGGTTTATSAGSGVIISSDGYIVTNAHVIEGLVDENTIEVKTYTGETYGAKVIGSDSRTDLAVLKIEAENLPYASFADSSELSLGQTVIAIGNPLGLGISVSDGIVSALEKEIYINNVYMTVLQTNAAVNEGNSGGGLFDASGNIVGIVNAKKSSSSSTTVEGMGYAIPSNTVVKIIDELIEYGYVKDRAALGVRIYKTSSYYNVSGAIVSEVIEGGGAQEAGLQVNDVITSINNVEVKSYADLAKILDSKTVGDVVTVKVLRDDKEMDFKVTLQATTNN